MPAGQQRSRQTVPVERACRISDTVDNAPDLLLVFNQQNLGFVGHAATRKVRVREKKVSLCSP